jgi:putative DNA primase/helicase
MQRALPDPAIREYVQRVVGYSLTASNREQHFWIHQGPGGTGKSVFVDVIYRLLGSQYAQALSSSTLVAKRDESGAIPSDVASMSGARFLAATETSPGKHLDDELIKRLTGGESVRARELYSAWGDFTPTGKIHIATNFEPVLSSGGKSMRRRLRLVPWMVEIPEEEQDKELKTRLLETEAAGILAWAVRGAMAWYEDGLRTPQHIVDVSARLVANADPLQGWLDERVERSLEAVDQVLVLQDYVNWCTRNLVKHPMSGKAFGAAMEERGYTRFQHAKTRRQMLQLELRKDTAPLYAPAYGGASSN